MNRLVIVDGNAILHRAYHALPPLTDPDGLIVNAVYGFTNILLKLFTDLKPTHIIVAFDRAAPTFRKTLYKEYQASRPKMDDDLIPQIEKVHDVVRAMGIPIFEMDGYEADDVIGTICNQVLNSKLKTQIHNSNIKNEDIDQIIIVTGDRDILQLVEEEKVYVYMPTKGLSESKLYGEKETVERMGVKPNQIPDYKALAGDQSDNYPGVGGIGPKTAVGLLTEFTTVMKLYQFLHGKHEAGSINYASINTNNELRIPNSDKKISDNLLQKLVDGEKDAMMSYELATIKRDVPIEITLKPIETINTPELMIELEKLGFKTMMKRFEKLGIEEETVSNKKINIKEPKKSPEDEGQQSLF